MATTGAGGGAYRRRVFIDVGAIGQIDEDGVHVLHVCDDDGQVGQCRQRSGLVLILGRHTGRTGAHSIGLERCCKHNTYMHRAAVCDLRIHGYTHKPLQSRREAQEHEGSLVFLRCSRKGNRGGWWCHSRDLG